MAQPAASLRVAARRHGILFAAWAWIALAGCQSPANVTFQGTTVQFFTWDRGSSREAALIEGRLALQDGCLFAVTDSDRYLLIWPRGWDAAEQAGVLVVRGDGHELRVGDDLHLSGGDHDRVFVEKTTGRTIPLECQTDEYAVVGGF